MSVLPPPSLGLVWFICLREPHTAQGHILIDWLWSQHKGWGTGQSRGKGYWAPTEFPEVLSSRCLHTFSCLEDSALFFWVFIMMSNLILGDGGGNTVKPSDSSWPFCVTFFSPGSTTSVEWGECHDPLSVKTRSESFFMAKSRTERQRWISMMCLGKDKFYIVHVACLWEGLNTGTMDPKYVFHDITGDLSPL